MNTPTDPSSSQAAPDVAASGKQPHCGSSIVAGSFNVAQDVAHDWQNEVDRLLDGQAVDACSRWCREVEAMLMEFNEHGALEGL